MKFQKVYSYIKGNINLYNFFWYYITYSNGISSPFYNLNYTIELMYHICCIYEKSQQEDYEFKLDDQGLYILLLTAIFMNFNTDDFNDDYSIKLYSIDTMERIVSQMLEDDIKKSIIDIVKNNIHACIYPYTIDDEYIDLYQRIMRECSFLIFVSNDLQKLINYKKVRGIKSWVDFLSSHISFILKESKNVKLDYSKQYVKDNIESCLKNINDFYKIIKGSEKE